MAFENRFDDIMKPSAVHSRVGMFLDTGQCRNVARSILAFRGALIGTTGRRRREKRLYGPARRDVFERRPGAVLVAAPVEETSVVWLNRRIPNLASSLWVRA